MRRRVLVIMVLTVALIVLGAIPAGAQTAAVIDQQQTDVSASGVLVGPRQTLAQTFTAGRTGTLPKVDLFLHRTESPHLDITVEIRTVEGDLPSEVVLASATIPEAWVPFYPNGAFVTVSFAAPATVATGTQYAIVASSPAEVAYGWNASRQDVYLRGAGYYRISNTSIWRPIRVPQAPVFGDLAFRTYVAPPVPISKDQCKNGGWRNFPGFKNQGDCVSFVATGGKNPPGGH